MAAPALDELTDDALAGPWRVWQRRLGHRYSLDDLATAWEAAQLLPLAESYCDLGTGLGSVLLMVAYKLPPETHVAAVEAQAGSHELARRNISRNGQQDRIRLLHGDLRDASVRRQLGGPFALITGTPPYFPPSEASLSHDEQRNYARLEMRGGIEAYQEAAASLLAPGGRFVVCVSKRAEGRVLPGARQAGLAPLRRRDVIPRAGGRKGPLFSIWCFGLGDDDEEFQHQPSLIARDAKGARTEASHQLREFFDLPANRSEPASPGSPR